MSIRKRERDGRTFWIVRYFKPDGTRTSKSFGTFAEAKSHDAAVQVSKDTGSYLDPNRSKTTVGAMADSWLASKLNLSPKTRDRYEGIVARHIRPRWGKVKLS